MRRVLVVIQERLVEKIVERERSEVKSGA